MLFNCMVYIHILVSVLGCIASSCEVHTFHIRSVLFRGRVCDIKLKPIYVTNLIIKFVGVSNDFGFISFYSTLTCVCTRIYYKCTIDLKSYPYTYRL